MGNRSKAKGTQAETAVVRHARLRGLEAQRVALAGSADQGDVWLGGGQVVIEVKAGRQAANPTPRQVGMWLAEADREAGNVPAAEVGVLVVKRAGSGASNCGDWAAVMAASDYDYLRGIPRMAVMQSWPHVVRLDVDTLCCLVHQRGWGHA